MILTMPFNRSIKVEFDCVTGGKKTITGDVAISKGILHSVNSHNIALYSHYGKLKLQVDTKVWDFTDEDLKITYHHNIANRTSVFRVLSPDLNFVLEYPAWWSFIPNFLPIEPEMDQDEDFLAYIQTVWQSLSIQKSLLKKWNS